MNKILLIEDNELIVKGLKYYLEKENFSVSSCYKAEEVEDTIYNNQFDLILLDISLPDGNGFDICKDIKKMLDTPIIFLTAKDAENDVVRAFDLGADDYIIKPFRNRELLSRINNVLKRYNKDKKEIVCGKTKIDLEANRVFVNNEEINLTSLEYKILVLLFQNKGKTVTREKILNKIWDYAGNIVNDNTLTVYIKRIREKLNDENIIKTIKGVGYRVDE